MKTMKTGRKWRGITCALAGAVLGAAATLAPPAHADLWGGDLPLLTGILAEAITEVSNLASMLTQIVDQVRLLKTMLSGLDPASFSSLTAYLRTVETTALSLTSGVRAMSYSLGRVDTDFEQIFPQNPSSASPAQQAQWVGGWNEEILGASQIAARQQTAIDRLGESSAKAEDVVKQSESASGELAQMQLIVQMLSILHTQLLTIHQTLATTGRVLTDMGASSASERQLSQARKQESLSNYTSRGDAVRVSNQLP